ncbi:MAG: DinB family protein [Bacteroidota bacterium]
MKQYLILIGLVLCCLSCSEQEADNSKLRSILTDQLKYSYTDQNWYVPPKVAINGLTAEQSNWQDSTDNNSIGGLVAHMTFWNEMQIRAFKGEDFSDFEIDNDITFTTTEWEKATKKLDSVQTELQLMVENASEEQLAAWATDLLNLSAHNAYHAGQIVHIRKRNGWWKKK